MDSLLVTPRKKSDIVLLEEILHSIKQVKSVKVISGDVDAKTSFVKNNIDFLVSHKSLAEDWLSEEDNCWDKAF